MNTADKIEPAEIRKIIKKNFSGISILLIFALSALLIVMLKAPLLDILYSFAIIICAAAKSYKFVTVQIPQHL